MKRGRVLVEMLQNMGTKPATILYPAEKVPVPDTFRGRIAILDDRCIGCSKCAIVCPAEAITMVADEREVDVGGRKVKRKKKPEVRLYQCIRCGLCEEYCPANPKAIHFTKEFAGAGTDKDVVVK